MKVVHPVKKSKTTEDTICRTSVYSYMAGYSERSLYSVKTVYSVRTPHSMKAVNSVRTLEILSVYDMSAIFTDDCAYSKHYIFEKGSSLREDCI